MKIEQQVCSEFRTLRGGGYYAIHKWLYKHYGKAEKCDNQDCKGISKRFHWALKKNRRYEHKRENFIMLCSSCHRLYDQTSEWILKAKLNRVYKPLSKEHKLKIALSMKGKNTGALNGNSWERRNYGTI